MKAQKGQWGYGLSGSVCLFLVIFQSVFFHTSSPAQQQQTLAIWGANGYEQAWVPTNLGTVKSAAIGEHYTVAALDNGRVRVWGGAYPQPKAYTNLLDASAVAACHSHTLVLSSNGTVTGWSAAPNFPVVNITNPAVSGVVSIAAAPWYSMELKSNGVVSQQNDQGPSSLNGLSNIRAIAASYGIAMALWSNGMVTTAVVDFSYDSGKPFLRDAAAIAAGYSHGVALRSNGTVVAWGNNYYGQTNVPSGLSNVVAIAAGMFHTLALRADRTLVGWGSDALGQITIPSGLTNVVSISAGGLLSMAIVSNDAPVMAKQPKGRAAYPGTTVKLGCTATGRMPLIFQWYKDGGELAGETNSIFLLTNVGVLNQGGYQVVVTNDFGATTSMVASVTVGKTRGWGNNIYEQLEVSAGVTNPATVSAGNGFVLALNGDGAVAQWGFIEEAPQAALEDVVAISAGGEHALVALSNGTVRTWGVTTSEVTNVPMGLADVVKVAAGREHSTVLRRDGTVVAWGRTNIPFSVTTVPVGLSNVIAIASGNNFSAALKSDGRITAWGNPMNGQTSTGLLTNVVAIATGDAYGLALKVDGTVKSWGSVSIPDLPPPWLSNVVAISAHGYSSFAALRRDGTVVVWGLTGTQATNVPTGVSNVVRLATGYDFHLAVTGDGRPQLQDCPPQRVVNAGSTLQLPALVAGQQPMSYQWQFNGDNLTDQTNTTLMIGIVPVTVEGDYRVVVSNAFGVVTSAVTTVTVTRDVVKLKVPPDGLQTTNGTAILQVSGLAGAGRVVLYASTNLLDWEPVLTNSPAVGVLNLSDEDATNYSWRYYRAVEGP